MLKATINPFSIQNVVYNLIKNMDKVTTLKLNILLNIINKQYKILFGETLWNELEFYKENGIQKSVWLDNKFGFLPENEEFGIEMFLGQEDNRHSKLPGDINEIVRVLKMLYYDCTAEELINSCFFLNINLNCTAEYFKIDGVYSEFYVKKEKRLYANLDVDTIQNVLLLNK